MNDVGEELKAEKHVLLWLDLETTGLDERNELILEVGWGISKLDLEWIMEPMSYLINADIHQHNDTKGVTRVEAFVDGKPHDVFWPVVKMHIESGLWKDLSTRGLMDLKLAERTILSVLNINTEALVTLAGSGVAQFDVRWLAYHMPELHARLTYYQIDTGAHERMESLLQNGEIRGTRKAAKHRAKDDILFAYDYARSRKTFMKTGQMPRQFSPPGTMSLINDAGEIICTTDNAIVPNGGNVTLTFTAVGP